MLFDKTNKRVKLRDELHRLLEQMRACEDMSSEEYANMLERCMEIHAILNGDLDTLSRAFQGAGTVLIGVTGLALAYRNDRTEEPAINKDTKAFARDWARPNTTNRSESFLTNLIRRRK